MTQSQAAATVCRVFWLPKPEDEDLSSCVSGQATGSKCDLTTYREDWRVVVLSWHLLEFHCSFCRGTMMRIRSYYHLYYIIRKCGVKKLAKRGRRGGRAEVAHVSVAPACCSHGKRPSLELH